MFLASVSVEIEPLWVLNDPFSSELGMFQLPNLKHVCLISATFNFSTFYFQFLI